MIVAVRDAASRDCSGLNLGRGMADVGDLVALELWHKDYRQTDSRFDFLGFVGHFIIILTRSGGSRDYCRCT